jgi:hypothetical protein
MMVVMTVLCCDDGNTFHGDGRDGPRHDQV